MRTANLVHRCSEKIRRISPIRPKLALVLGSGFHHITSQIEVEAELSYAKLPGFPPVGVAGHTGKLLLGYLGDTAVLILSGRAHFFEGHAIEQVTFPVRALAEYGIIRHS